MEPAPVKLEPDTISISDLVKVRAADPTKAAALARARKKLAQSYPVPSNESFAKLRMEQGLSQAQLADKMGVSQPYVAKIEKGDDNLSIATIEKLAIALGVSPELVFSVASYSRKLQGGAR